MIALALIFLLIFLLQLAAISGLKQENSKLKHENLILKRQLGI